jgi:uncharacterized protein (TIGR02300 family)
VSKPELGTKRVCPETERKFYDLNRNPIVSPYTGKSYPLSFFEVPETVVAPPKEAPKEKPKEEEPKAAEAEKENVEIVSLEDADDEASDTGETIPDLEDDDDDVDIGEDDADTFLETDDDDDDDVKDIINVADDGEET